MTDSSSVTAAGTPALKLTFATPHGAGETYPELQALWQPVFDATKVVLNSDMGKALGERTEESIGLQLGRPRLELETAAAGDQGIRQVGAAWPAISAALEARRTLQGAPGVAVLTENRAACPVHATRDGVADERSNASRVLALPVGGVGTPAPRTWTHPSMPKTAPRHPSPSGQAPSRGDAQESVVVISHPGGIEVVVRSAQLAAPAAVDCAMETARHLTGSRQGLNRVTLNGAAVYENPAAGGNAREEVPARREHLVFSC